MKILLKKGIKIPLGLIAAVVILIILFQSSYFKSLAKQKITIENRQMLATLLLTLRGTPYLYQGDEIGMTNLHFNTIGECRDIESINFYQSITTEAGWRKTDALKAISAVGRDNARSPIQWNKSRNAGFTKGKPWLKINPNYQTVNVADQLQDQDSI